MYIKIIHLKYFCWFWCYERMFEKKKITKITSRRQLWR